MPAVIRFGDPVTCGDRAGNGSSNVFINNRRVIRKGIDRTQGHCFPPVPFLKGSPNVFVNNIPVVFQGSPIPKHCCGKKCHSGVAARGSPNVFVN